MSVLPSVLIELGTVLELQFSGRKKKFSSWVLATNQSRTSLFIFCPVRSTPYNRSVPASAERTWTLWSDFEVDGGRLMPVPNPTLRKQGTAEFIVYRSDKWDAKPNDYIHRFTSSPAVLYGSVRREKNTGLYVIRGGKLRVRAAGITG